MMTKNIALRISISVAFLILIGGAFYFDVFSLGAATVRNETSCLGDYCSGSNSKLTAVRNGDYISTPKGPNPKSNDDIGAVCCTGDWEIDVRGGNWWSECNGSPTGWGACVDNPAGGTQSIVACSFPKRTGTCTGYNSKITGIAWNGLDQGYICCDGAWTQTAAPVYCGDYTCDTIWTGDCNTRGNGYVAGGGFYQCGYPNSGNNTTSGTPSLTVTSPTGGTYTAGTVIPIRWQTSGFANRYANIQLMIENVSLAPNHLGGSYGSWQESYDDGTEDLAVVPNMLTGQYYAKVRACNPDYLGGQCVEKKSGNFNIIGIGDPAANSTGTGTGAGTGTGFTPAPTPIPTPTPGGSFGTFKIVSEALPAGRVGEPYSAFIFAVNGGTDSFSWSVVGSLPAGLEISNPVCTTNPCQGPGRLSGLPTAASSGSVTIKVVAGTKIATKTLSLNIAAAGGGGTPTPTSSPSPSPSPTPTPMPTNLIRVNGQDKVYRIISGKALWVPTLAAFSAQGLSWNDVQAVSAATLAQYPLARLIQADGDIKVYYLTDAGQKRHLINEAVFSSYGNSWANVVNVNAAILNSYANAVLIESSDTHKVYKIENNQKRWIKTDAVFRQLGLNWSEVSVVNATELAAYPEGAEIADLSAVSGCDTLTDTRDNKTYRVVQIGNQCWMKDNLNVGTRIAGNVEQTNNNTIEKYCYGNSDAKCASEGGLYQWNEGMDYSATAASQGVCPTGWHLPTDAEYCAMVQAIDSSVSCADTAYRGLTIGTKLKVGGSSGFEARLAGFRHPNLGALTFYDGDKNGSFWTSSDRGADNSSWKWSLYADSAGVGRFAEIKPAGLSVRCVKSVALPD